MEKAVKNEKAKWIWDKKQKQNDWVLFRKEFAISEQIRETVLKISAVTRYFLSINGETAVIDGGLFRDAYCKNSGYLETVDITKYLKPGDNVMEILVWHYGNGGRNNNPLPNGGLLFFCEKLGLYSDRQTKCMRHPSYVETGEPASSYLFGGWNIGFDARKKPDASDGSQMEESVEYEDGLYGCLYERPVPLFRFSERIRAEYQKTGEEYRVRLPHALHVLPWFRIRAAQGTKVDISHDRYEINGGPGDECHSYRGHRTEYWCAEGINDYLNLDYFPCEEIIFRIPEGTEVLELGYVISEYDCDLVNLLHTEDERVNRLTAKCARTLKFCMRDNFMDCPDRERGQWIGDVSVQAPQVFYALDSKAVPLLKKAIQNFLFLKDGDRLIGNVPGIHSQELPSQSLNAISEIGMIAGYYEFTGDDEILEQALTPAVRYLKLWDMDHRGLVVKREGNWYWFDHLYNVDCEVLENAWYYSALRFALKMSDILKTDQYRSFLKERIAGIRNRFHKEFWNGRFYASGQFADDRANAMAVLTGLAEPSAYPQIRTLLISSYQCSTYMEGYVCEALIQMGYPEDGFRRMMNRYAPLIDNDNSTLWEDFAILGTRNHAWTGSPLTLLYRYFAGIGSSDHYRTIELRPDFRCLGRYELEMEFEGKRIRFRMEDGEGAARIAVKNETDRVVKAASAIGADGKEKPAVLVPFPDEDAKGDHCKGIETL